MTIPIGIKGAIGFRPLVLTSTLDQSMDEGTESFQKSETKKECPENKASLLSQICFQWMTPFMRSSRLTQIEVESLWEPNSEHKAVNISVAFRASLQKEFPPCMEATTNHNCSVFRSLVCTFWIPFLQGTFCKLINDLSKFGGPLMLKGLLRYARTDEPLWVGCGYALGMLVLSLLQTCMINVYFHKMFTIGMHIRTVVVSSVYDKALMLSSPARLERTTGEIVNLMSNDTQKLMDIVKILNMIWSAPLQILLSIFLIYLDLGPAVFAGLLFMIILIPVNSLLARLQKEFQARQMKDKDMRLKMMNEILNGIKVLKLYAWELGFKKVIDDIRTREIRRQKKIAFIKAFLAFLWFTSPFVVSLITFGTYVMMSPDNHLTSEKAFVSLALFQMLRVPLTMLPNLITSMMDASVSLKRLDNFIKAPNLEEYVTNLEVDSEAISIQNGSFVWNDATILHGINMDVKKGDLVAVVGQVGSGKSSLISAILGEIRKISGEVNVFGSIAYVSQQAWMRNATLRDNILFGKAFDHDRYWEVIRRCALFEDLKMLPAGDQTEIGEKGINLSGGQKQRINIARAVYADCDIYLFDDPLSAVDFHVGDRIFNRVISDDGALSSKTRILVTHGISYLHHMDKIFVIRNGAISQTGSFDELMEEPGEFRDLIEQFSQVVDEVDVEKKEKEEVRRSTVRMSLMSARDAIGAKIVTKERTETGKVQQRVYQEYMKALGYFGFLLVAVLMFSSTGMQVASSFWLAAWSQDKANENQRNYRLMVYGLLGLGQGLMLLAGLIQLSLINLKAARILHDQQLYSILRAPMSFFDSTPLGRIVNRFARDINVVDQSLSHNIRMYIVHLLQLLSIAVVICYNAWIFIFVIIPVGAVYHFIQIHYIAACRQLRRLESITKSPIYSHFSETLQGVSVIRAYRRQKHFIHESNEKIDANLTCYYPQICANRWLEFRLDVCASLVVFSAAMIVSVGKDSLDASTVGLCMSYALTACGSLNAYVKSSSDIEVNIVSVERILEYIELESEAPWRTGCSNIEPTWPQNGAVEFKSYSAQFRPELPFVVSDINVKIAGGEKVGIVGRTGAGKSSLTLALFRIIEAAQGSIEIDGVTISEVGLHDLREKLAVIPQDPGLFSGTIRMNLDPFQRNSDDDLWQALEDANLGTFVHSLEKGLDSEINEGGENLSAGQRQLMCLARALLRKCKILVLDEATAAVDVETDHLIQEMIRNKFQDSTILTIAHRINTIINYDKVIVLDGGKIVEFDSPQILLEDEQSMFHSIVEESRNKK